MAGDRAPIALRGAVLVTRDPTAGNFYSDCLGWSDGGNSAAATVVVTSDPTVPPGWYPAFESAGTAEAVAQLDGVSLHRDRFGATFAVSTGVSGYEPRDPQPGHLSWAQLNTSDLDAHPALYAQAHGWEIGPASNDKFTYRRFEAAGDPVAGIMRIDERSGLDIPVGWQLYFRSESVAESAERIVAAGGTLQVPPTEITGGSFLVAMDPNGVLFAVDRMSH